MAAECNREFDHTLKGKGFLASDKRVRVRCKRPKRHDGACAPGPTDDDLRGRSSLFGW